ncbi:hypothetical protein MPC1_50008 [Methylocella tundrae]|nr:hypothetical protein MPC1_50008 [Methylocella tundrae]
MDSARNARNIFHWRTRMVRYRSTLDALRSCRTSFLPHRSSILATPVIVFRRSVLELPQIMMSVGATHCKTALTESSLDAWF